MDSAKKAAAVLEKYELDPTDKAILQHVLGKPGITDSEIGVLVGLSRRQVNERRNADKLQKVLLEFQAEPIEMFRTKLRKAAQKVIKTMDSTNEKLAFEAACRILYSEGVLRREQEHTVSIGPNVIQINKLNGDAAIYETQFIEKKPK